MDILLDKTVKGIGWSLFSRIGRQSTQILLNILLARLLIPGDFGLLGMIAVFIGFANIFIDMGFGSALIQKKEINTGHYNSIFWLNLIAGTFLTLIFIVISPLISRFYGETILNPLTKFISLSFIIGSLGVVQTSILKKSLNFKHLAIVEIGALIISGVVAIVAAILGLGVWSLALQAVSLSLFTVVLLWMFGDWRPTMFFQWNYVKELLGFSSNLLGFSSFNYWIRNIDNLLIGKVLGTVALGIYSNAYRILLMPIYLVSNTIGQVLFPAFSTIQEDTQKIAKIYLKMTSVIAMITFPMMMLLFVLSDYFVLALFGDNWSEMIPILRIFSVVGLLQSIGTINGNLYLSQGRTDLQLKVGIIVGLIGIVAMVIGLRWGIKGVAMAYGIVSILLFYPSVNIAVSLVGLKASHVIKKFFGVLICSLIVSIFVWSIDQLFPRQWTNLINLIVLSTIGSILYLAMIHILNLEPYRSTTRLVAQQLQLIKRPDKSVPISK